MARIYEKPAVPATSDGNRGIVSISRVRVRSLRAHNPENFLAGIFTAENEEC